MTMKYFYIFCLNVFVFAGQSVVDKTTVEEGQAFTITCDHLHVNGTIPSCPLVLFNVEKHLPKSFTIIISLPDYVHKKVPPHWREDCKNPKASLSEVTQFQCKLIVKEAKMSDSGKYVCVIGVGCSDGPSTRFEGVSNLVVLKAKSEASSNFGERTTIGLCLMVIAGTQLYWYGHLLNG